MIDLTQNVAGPFCTQILGDMGAEVVKIERPGRGDDTREWRPPEVGGESSTFLALNRNKKSVCIDLGKTEGVDLLRRLVAGSDVFIHSMKPGSAEARGFGEKELRAANDRLIYCAISAFGQDGPLGSLPGYDPLMQAFTGVMSVTGNDGDDPVRVGVSLIDMGTGLWAALGILGALIERGRSGKGALVEASLLDTGLAWMTVPFAGYFATGNLPKKMGTAMAMMAPYELFEASDGHVFIAAGNDALFVRVCQGIDAPELAQDERFLTNSRRVAGRTALRDEINARTRAMTVAEVVDRLRRHGAPCSELQNIRQAIEHPQVRAAEMIAELPIPGEPGHKAVAMPLRLQGRRSAAMAAPPPLGGHTDDVLGALGCDGAELERLRHAGIVG